MKAGKARILFVSHKANKSGAPVLLLEIVKDFSRRTNMPLTILSMEDGELVADFKKLGRTFVWEKTAVNGRGFAPYQRIVQVLRGLFIIYKVRRSTLVFYNTIVNGHLQNKLSSLSCKSICYVHELEAAIHMLTNAEGRRSVFKHTDLFLAVSEAVRTNLLLHHGVDEGKVKIVSSPLSVTGRSKLQYKDYTTSFRSRLGADAVVIGVVANNEWRKGFDLFISLVVLYFQLFPDSNTYFVWKGFNESHYTAYYDLYDYQKCACQEKILLLPHGNDSIDQMACFDIHLLMSREDPYPLVVLEAATLGVPTVCFDNAGGAPEFVENDCGFVVPYNNLFTMASKLENLAGNSELRRQMGINCQRKVAERHDREKALQRIAELIMENAGAPIA
jgi:glycosyltransferase involved in cell wall biosynthesis